jgi:hypothetical protein
MKQSSDMGVCPICKMALSKTKTATATVAVQLTKGGKVMYCCVKCKMPPRLLASDVTKTPAASKAAAAAAANKLAASKATAVVPNGIAGTPTTIIVKDVGNIKATVTVTITGANPQTLTLVNNGDGTYLATYTPTKTGDDAVAVAIGSTPIKGSPYNSNVSSALVIRKAVYGDLPDGPTADVTDKVRAMVKNGKLSVEAIPGNFDDPAKGIRPTRLRVIMHPQGMSDEDITSRVNELVAFKVSEPTTVYYTYGDGVTHSGEFAANVYASIPPYAPYKLRVDYTLNGVDMSVTNEDYKPVEIPDVETTHVGHGPR